MKKTLSVILVFLLIMSGLVLGGGLSAAASEYLSQEVLDGTDNLFLSYTFYHQDWSRGRRTKEGYLPLVGYTNPEGEVTDIFFDSFLFLPCVTSTPSGGRTYRDNSNPANFSDWQLFVEDVFMEGYNVPALNEAVGEVKQQLGGEFADFKANVFLTVLYPVRTQTNFGDVDGDGVTENFNNLADRQKAIKWIIDEQLSVFEQGSFENLNLVGFYWFEENIAYSDPHEINMISYMNNYVQAMDYKTIWIPYYTASGYDNWESLGFDAACYQPNYMFNESAPASRVETACQTAKSLGMGVEIEIFGGALTSVEYYNRYMRYLKDCTEQGANQGVKMYYNDAVNGVYYDTFMSENPTIRRIYDLTYKYASQTLDPSEIVFIDESSINDAYDIVSLGCSYTTTAPFTNSDAGYASVSGTELTDGKFGSSAYGTEWIAFHNSQTEDGYYYIDLDLGAVYDDLSLFSLELNELLSSGISLPSSVQYYISENGIDYQSIGFASFERYFVSYTTAIIKRETPVSARYIRVEITPGTHNFVFASELSVGIREQGRLGEGQYNNIALDKVYTATIPFTDSSLGYAEISGNELTDGIYGNTLFGTEWHAFHISNAENDLYTVTVDLGKQYSGIARFGMEFSLYLDAAIALPSSVKYYGSSDGVSYTLYGEVSPVLHSGNIYDAVLDTDAKKARYIRAVFDTGSSYFVFASEFFIGVRADVPVLTPTEGASIALDKENGLCMGLTENRTAEELMNMFEQTVVVRNADGNVVSGGTIVGTGFVVEYNYNQQLVEEYTISILGDINGDGRITSIDFLMIKRAFLGTYVLNSAAEAAADINGDKVISSSDFLRIKRHFLGTYNIYEQ